MTGPTRSTRRGTTGTRRAAVSFGEDDRLEELDARLARLESAPGLRERGRTLMDRVMPPEASEHFRNAGREHLLGMRSIVDHWIRKLDEADDRAARGANKRETINIE